MKSGSHKRKDTYNHPKEGSENISSNYSSIPIQKIYINIIFFFLYLPSFSLLLNIKIFIYIIYFLTI